MSKSVGRLIVSVGGATVAVVGASAGAVSASTIIIASGVAISVIGLGGLAGYGLYRKFSGDNPPPQLFSPKPTDPPPPLPGGGQICQLPQSEVQNPAEHSSSDSSAMQSSASAKKPWWRVWG